MNDEWISKHLIFLTFSEKGNCVTKPSKKPDSKHPLDEYVKAANNLKAWIETGQKGLDGKRGLKPHGNEEECLPIIKTPGALDVSLTLLGLGLIKINDVSANFNNPRPSLILNN